MKTAALTLMVQRRIRAPRERVFAAWTEPSQLIAWWGPRPVKCVGAAVDLRVGGAYHIVNELPTGARLTIKGEFVVVEVPSRLVYTWELDDGSMERSRVTVRFEEVDGDTQVIVVHEEIPSEAVRNSHERGWIGCLDGLETHFHPPR